MIRRSRCVLVPICLALALALTLIPMSLLADDGGGEAPVDDEATEPVVEDSLEGIDDCPPPPHEQRETTAEILLDPHPTETTRDFADHLLEHGDSYRAIGEYKRYLFLAPGAHDADLVTYRIGLAYALGKQNENALAHFERVERDAAARPEIRHAAWAAAGRAFFDLGQHGAASIHLAHRPATLTDQELMGWAAYTRGFAHLERFDLARAAEAFDDVPAATAWSEPAILLAAELHDPPRLSRRSPVLAGLMSIVPGLGHMYLGMWGTAFSALTWNGAFIWAMYETGKAGNWALFSLLAVIESLWYTGTIYGAVAGAYRHNRDARRNYLDDLRSRAPAPLPPPQPAAIDARPLELEGIGGY